jgi:hypothetical protein
MELLSFLLQHNISCLVVNNSSLATDRPDAFVLNSPQLTFLARNYKENDSHTHTHTSREVWL